MAGNRCLLLHLCPYLSSNVENAKQAGDVRDDFDSFLSGFGGPECNFEYNECESNPCTNGGPCLDRVGEFQCICPVGYAGSRCETQVHPFSFYDDAVLVERSDSIRATARLPGRWPEHLIHFICNDNGKSY